MVNTIQGSSLANRIAMVIVLLMTTGTVFVFSAGVNVGREIDLQRLYELPGLRQLVFFPLAVLIMYGVGRINYRRLSLVPSWFASPTVYILGLSIVLLVLVLFPQFGTEINQARRWLRIPAGPVTLSFQPSELAKWAVIFFLAGFCDRYAGSLGSFWGRFVPVCGIVGVVVGLIVIEDLGTAAFVSLLSFFILLIAGAKLWHVLTPLPFGLAGFCVILLRSPWRMQRIKAFLNPEQWADSAAYQANQSLIALGSGGFFGKGLGRGISKYGHLPEDTTDFIFAIIREELGFVGAAFVILLFVIFVWLGILVVMRCADRFGRLLAVAIVLAISLQAALNIGVVTVVLPTKGIPLPFVSAGGTSMLLSAAAVGVLLNIARGTKAESIEVSE